ncbi:NmrA-like family domain-containing protein 1 [Fulvia fulva]|uniref:NmrA-like family domain-containing protein 1 n=1 Tax=Passalora fulva TaxID=5499 RepID=A0A9Q8PAK4_PASFU|nr:NmrA-like family domain-containing protein 1 [Fulvia fulva]KAK4622956.1 NmrA-like family domain-containing protein 1 [Fulvia fulva]UJO18928.1 NmrA-like family domain-containing protein 1 [Fulvia fulva]
MPTDKKLIVIIGITGQQGGSVAKVFQSEPGWHFRGVTREPYSTSDAHLREAGIELIAAADLDNVPSLERAFEGADAIFSVTDFWQFVKPGRQIFAQARQQNRQPIALAYEREFQQGKNIIDAAAKVHAMKPLHRLTISTLADLRKWSNGESSTIFTLRAKLLTANTSRPRTQSLRGSVVTSKWVTI